MELTYFDAENGEYIDCTLNLLHECLVAFQEGEDNNWWYTYLAVFQMWKYLVEAEFDGVDYIPYEVEHYDFSTLYWEGLKEELSTYSNEFTLGVF